MATMSYRDKETLEHLYYEKRMSLSDIADEFDVVPKTIINWMDNYGLERRDDTEARNRVRRSKPVPYQTDRWGYPTWTHQDHKGTRRVRVHRLMAVAEFGFEAMEGMDTHHKNGVKWDNRPENLEVLTPSEHTAEHAQDMLKNRWQA